MTAAEREFFQPFKFAAEEIRQRFRNAHRDLEIAEKDPFPEVRFTYAFQALIKTGMALCAQEGRKVRSLPGHHVKILERMSEILADSDILVFGNSMRMKRNQDLYGAGELISEKESGEYLVFVRKVLKRAEERK
ncbi:MAG: hypothetical protein WC530_10180 [Candidatus Omnitrophota bacterium]|jgi:hypothetical protein